MQNIIFQGCYSVMTKIVQNITIKELDAAIRVEIYLIFESVKGRNLVLFRSEKKLLVKNFLVMVG